MRSTSRARALVLEAPRAMSVREFDVPAVGDDDAVLRVEACGLCGTDHEVWSGAIVKQLPLVPGHEAIGIIEQIGSRAAAKWGLAVGDRVGVAPRQACGACARCLAGDRRGCERHRGDTYGSIPLTTAPSLWGGYAEVQYLSPDSQLVRVPTHLDPVLAAMYNAVANGIRWGAVVPGTKPGDVVAVLGPGVRGLSAAAAAREAGARFVMVTGYGAGDAARLRMAKAFGADLVVDVAVDDPLEALRDACGSLADVVVDVTAMAPAAFVQALDLAKDEGTVCVAGIHGDAAAPGFRPDVIVLKQLRVLGTRGTDSAEFGAAIELIASGRYPFEQIPTRTADLEHLPELLRTLAGEGTEPPPPFAALVIDWKR
ncbi:MAG TPA: zinc-binding dehydrogenase [Acidimicrobiales bacterium]|nr:zinc-binding dehydrogenase [Acidimicrobiales bacterium]